MKNELWHMPAYYPHFHCKMDKCRHSCCSSWKIPVSRSEYLALINMECSDELYGRVQRAFEEPDLVTEECYRYICFNWLGQCPLQDRGLCNVHREKGEDFLPKICRLYPRSLKRINGYNVASCSGSCEAVLEYLYDHDEMSIIARELKEVPEMTYTIEEKEIGQIVLFQKIVQDRSTTLAQSIEAVCRIVNEKQFAEDLASLEDPIEAMIGLLKRFLHTNAQFEEIVAPIIERYTQEIELYQKDVQQFETDCPSWMSFFERVINNSMIYENFPFVDQRFDRTDSYKGLCVCYGMMRMICAGSYHFHPNTEHLIDALAALFHLIDHTAFYYNIHVLAEHPAIMLKL